MIRRDNMAKITSVHAREVLDSQGNPTVSATVVVDGRFLGEAKVPSGTSTGEKEALELRDKDDRRFHGKGVLNAVENINGALSKEILNKTWSSPWEIDQTLVRTDGSENKTKLGANALLAVSLAFCRASAESEGIPLYRYIGGIGANSLPVPMMNIINGGRHADNNVDIQEFMIVPFGFDRFSDALRAGSEIFHSLKQLLQKNGYATSVGAEGGFAPDFINNEEPLVYILQAIRDAGYRPYEQIGIALDIAASELYDKKEEKYRLAQRDYTASELIEFYRYLIENYPILSIEDGLDENDEAGWKKLTEELADRVLLIGDDLFVTNEKILLHGIEHHLANGILIKLNQIGTLSETISTVHAAQNNHYIPIISHRSGETEDTFIADLAVGLRCPLIKTGSLSRSERIAKYNRLLEIEEELGEAARFSAFSLKKIFRAKKDGAD